MPAHSRAWHAHPKTRRNSTKPNRSRMSKHTRIVSEQDHVLRTTGPQIKRGCAHWDKYSTKTRISHLPPDVSVPTTIRSGQVLVSNVSNDEIQQLMSFDTLFQRISNHGRARSGRRPRPSDGLRTAAGQCRPTVRRMGTELRPPSLRSFILSRRTRTRSFSGTSGATGRPGAQPARPRH